MEVIEDAVTEDLVPANTDQESQGNGETARKRKRVDGIGSYSFDQCEYRGSKSVLNKKSKHHENISYPCNQCEYVANEKFSLKRHKISKHDGVGYPCDLCDYAASRPSNLKKHKESSHSTIYVSNVHTDIPSTILRGRLSVRLERLNYTEYMKNTKRKDKTLEHKSAEHFLLSEEKEQVFNKFVNY